MVVDRYTSLSGLGTSRVFRASSLQREYRAVLDLAHSEPVQVLDRDDTVLGVVSWDRLTFQQGIVQALAQIGQFSAVVARHGAEPPAEWAAMTPYPFLAALSEDEIAEFTGELMPSLLLAVRQQSLEPFLGNLRAWESSTERLDDPEMVAAMNVDLRTEAISEIFPPTETEAVVSDA